jgi:hypothetical protein
MLGGRSVRTAARPEDDGENGERDDAEEERDDPPSAGPIVRGTGGDARV